MEENYARENDLEESGILSRFYNSYDSCYTERDISFKESRRATGSLWSSLWTCSKVSLETVLSGVLVGLFATLLWWIELNVRPYCLGDWSKIPSKMHRTGLIVDIVEGMTVMFWSLCCIAFLCHWTIVKELNLLYICTFGAFMDVINRLILFIFVHYGRRWKSYIGNIIFLVTTFIIYFRFAKYRRDQAGSNYCVIMLTLKLSLQFTVGLLITTFLNYIFLEVYYKSTSLEQTILACVLVIIFFIPKFLINNVITGLNGICKPGEEIAFAVTYITAVTMISRLLQAKIETLSYYIIISIIHGIFNVIDKLSLPLRRKLVRFVCKCKNNGENTHVDTSLFLANQSLISIITETTSVIFSSAAAYILLYYYKREESTGQRYNGFVLFKEMAKRSSIAVAIELIFNVFALKIHAYLYSIPVINVWKSKWKSIIIVHVVQIFFIVIMFSEYIDNVLLRDYYIKANITCFGFFKRV